MKYESSILKRLIEVYGVVGNPRYISEIIKQFIVQGKECYPNLFTYQADWLAHIDEFGLTPEYTVSYTGQHIYAPNTKEKPVKRAILKGSTKYRDNDTGEILETFEDGRNLELVSVKMPGLTTTGKNLFPNITFSYKKLLVENTGEIISAMSDDWACEDYLEVPTQKTMYTNMNYIGLKWTKVCFYDENKNYISVLINDDTINFPENAKYWRVGGYADAQYGYLFNQVMLCKSLEEAQSTYEPYKSNILSCNEEVILRGFGDVQDTLDLLTGKIVQNIGEIVLDGSEDWFTKWNDWNENMHFFFSGNTQIKNLGIGICDKFIVNKDNPSINKIEKSVQKLDDWGQDYIVVTFPINELDTPDVSGFKKWLSENNVTIQYIMSEPTVKTVDLSILDQNGQNVKQLMSFNGGTHFTTSSQDGSLLPTLTVDVVTDLEETLMVCSLEGNTI